VADIIGKGRTKPVVFARQVAMYLSREITQESLPQIGVAFGNKDHTTVMHSTEKIAKLVDEDNTVERQLQAIRTKLTE
ncbi:helix-turn-helix domain-containing protein, partial [Weissella soli]